MKRTLLLVVALVTLAATAQASAATPLAGWWPLYEGSGTVAHDSTLNHDNGTLSGGVSWSSGYFGPALSFNDSSAQVDVPDSPGLEPKSGVSVAAYVRATGSPGAYKYIVAKGASGCLASSYALYTGINGGLEFYVSQSGGISWVISPDAGTGIWNGNWHLVVGTYDGSAVRLYVDGRQVGSGTPLSGPIGYGLLTNNDLLFGNYAGCEGLNFTGSLDEPTVWSRALSPVEVSTANLVLSALHGHISRLPSFPNS